MGRYNPWGDAADRHPDVHIERCSTRPARGAWVPSEKVILLERTLSRPERNTVLAHEIAHIDLDHEPTGRKWFDRRQERDADQLAAERLVDIDSLADALGWALCAEEVAAELDVTAAIVRLRLRGLTLQEKDHIERRLLAAERGA